jgi:hypothetical protein
MKQELDDQEISQEDWMKWLQSWPLSDVDECWITREGKLYACDEYLSHGYIAKSVLGEGGELAAERQGWLRISDYGVTCTKPWSQAQQNKVWDWCQAHGLDYEEWVAKYA